MEPVSYFEQWLDAYGRAWEQKDTAAFTSLFTAEADYYWTPFEAPKKGTAGIADAFNSAVARQRDIAFGYEVLAVPGTTGIAHWWCSFVRTTTGRTVHLDGLLMAVFEEEERCAVFREWWHSDEPPAQDG